LVVLFLSCPVDGAPVLAGEVEPLEQAILLIQQDWGEMGLNRAAHAKGKEGRPLQIGDNHYDKGIGTHANSRISVDLLGEYAAFETEIGVQDHPDHDNGSVVFQVFVDGEKRFDSGVMRQSDPVQPVHIDVTGAYDMDLVVTDGGDGIECDLANWANATLTCADVSVERERPERVNIAPFARVMTWDPAQTGSHPGRVEELSVDQIFLGDVVVPDAAGVYTAPKDADGRACIGLQWYENRLLAEVVLLPAADVDESILSMARVEYWVGESEWQGDWERLEGGVVREGERWVTRIGHADLRKAKNGLQKVRWVFPASGKPVRIRTLEAYTRSRPGVASVRLEIENPAEEEARVRLYNGERVEPALSNEPSPNVWNLAKPLRMKVRYLKTKPGFAKSDRAVLCLDLPDGAFGVAIEDVVEHGCVYVPDFGLFVTLEPDGPTLEEHLETIVGRNTVLQDVRTMPDQSFNQAMERVHRKVQNNGPTMLSLACDNHKFTVYEDGGVQHRHDHEIKPDEDRKKLVYNPKYPVQIDVTLNSEKVEKQGRRLENGWVPILNTAYGIDGVTVRQRAFVTPYDRTTAGDPRGWLNPKPLFVAEYAIDNPGEQGADVSFQLAFRVGEELKGPAPVKAVARGAIAFADELLLAFVDTAGAPSLDVSTEQGRMTLTGRLSSGTSERFLLYIPGWDARIAEHALLEGGMDLDKDVGEYWRAIMEPVMQVRIPEPLLQNFIYASQVHCLMTARNEMNGARIAPWCGADRYGPLESESQAIIHGMSLMGHDAFAQRSLDYFIRRYNEDGLLTTGYTLMGVGWHLWTLADYYAVHKDTEWLSTVALRLERACEWIAGECEKTKRLNPDGTKPLEYGLVSPGVAADWSRFAYRSRSEGEYYAGLMGVARSYADIGYPGSSKLLADAAQLREAIRRSYGLTQARSPVVQLRNGTWVPYSPAIMGCFGRVMDMYPNEDGGRSWGKDMSMGAHNLVVLGVLDQNDRRSVDWIANYLEDFWCVQGGMGAYPLEETTEDWFNLGGFSKVQPYYTRLVEMHALMDEVKPFIRAYFNAIPSLLNTENLNFWEHFGNGGAWNKPHETGWFLAQTRIMLVMERGSELWLAPFVTTHWMHDGMAVGVENAPTRFGNVSYTIMSHVDDGFIEAEIDPPTRSIPEAIVVRLRHPEGKRIQSVEVNGKPHADFDPEKECICLQPGSE
ncbi:MAG: NPCBM/NEW2 domain-containing protein, partial [Candidatus Hydrogenedentota bacterium]